ncbi:hypothetical protein GS416_00235 [Rhodococcus hoagii]|nr:hypothetical protein [Prescottella equi]
MAAVTLRDGHELDVARLAAHLFDRLPSYAVPLFVRVVDSLETTSTFKSRRWNCGRSVLVGCRAALRAGGS